MSKTAGIDIGKHSIKLIEMEDKKGHLEITKCAMRRVTDGDVKSALGAILADAKLSMKRVTVSLSGPSVIVRYIEMPTMKREELKSAIKFEAEKYIPFDIKDSIVDCAMLDKASPSSQRVLLVAAKKNNVTDTLELFKQFGLEINAIDIDSFALLNCFQRIEAKKSQEDSYAIVNIGARFANMNIITKDNAYFTRDILWGGIDVSNRIKDATGIGFEEAEELKKNPAERRDEIANIVTPVTERFVSQIRMSLDYFESQFARGVDRLYVSGGTSYLFNIIDFLKDSLGVESLMWNPFERIKISESVDRKLIEGAPAVFSVAVGLALRK